MIQPDKNTIQYVLGSLMLKPQLLSEVDKYKLSISDFNTKFEKIIFNAIECLYEQSANALHAIDIDNFLSSDAGAHGLFEANNGIEYINDILEFGDADNFPYYYNKLKKFNLLRDFQKNGIDTKEFYIEDLADPKALEINEQFERLTIDDIILINKKKILKLENNYGNAGDVEIEAAAEGLDELVTHISDFCDMGLPVQGTIFNEIISGAQKGCLTIRSGSSGLSKTRQAVGDACYLAYPLRYSEAKHQWVQEGSCKKVLMVVTEQTLIQVRKMILAYLTELNESLFKYADLTEDQSIRIKQAIQIMKMYRDNFIIIKHPNPSIESIKNLIRENVLTRNIDYVFYDYIFISNGLINEFRGSNLRNDK